MCLLKHGQPLCLSVLNVIFLVLIYTGPRAADPSATRLQSQPRTRGSEESLHLGPEGGEPSRQGGVKKYAKSLRKRRSFLQTDHTSQVSFPMEPSAQENVEDVCYYDREPYLTLAAPSPTVSSLQDMQGEPGLLETKALGLLASLRETKSKNPASRIMEMEPETMETKSVIDSRVSSISAIRLRIDPSTTEHLETSPLAVATDGSSASIPHNPQHSNPGSSSPQAARVRPFQTVAPGQDPGGTIPKELAVQPEDGTYPPSSADPNPDSPGPHHVPQGDTSELEEVRSGMGSGSLLINHIQEDTPQITDSLCPGDGPTSSECEVNLEDMALAANEVRQGQLSLDCDSEVTHKDGPSLFQEGVGEGLGDFTGDKLDNGPQAPDVSAPAGEISSSLCSEPPATGIGQISPGSEGENREAQEQELLTELDLGPDFLLGEQSAFPPETIKIEQLDHVIEEGLVPGDTSQLVCVHTVPSLPKLSPCGEEPRSADSGHGSPAESKGDSPIICLAPERSFLCFAPESHPEGSTSLSTVTSFGFSGINEVEPAGIGIEHCRCQLSYTTCFRGLQPETEEEDGDPQTHPAAPLTSPPSAGSQVTLPWRAARAYSCTTPLSRKSHIWPEYCSRALRQLKTAPANTPEGFVQLTESLLELQDILEASWGVGNKHPPDKCTWHFSESRSRLCMGSQKLLASCQHVIRMDQSPEEMQGAVRVTFQHLVQLAGLCFQFTDCSRCSTLHREVAGNLRDVVYTYHQFVEAAKLTCERGYHDLSVKLLARQCTALTAAVFCLTQKFRASTAL